MQFTLIVPAIVETQCTGFIGAGEKMVRGKLWRAELRAGQVPTVRRDGQGVPLHDAPRHALELIKAVREALKA